MGITGGFVSVLIVLTWRGVADKQGAKMNRREFSKRMVLLGMGLPTGAVLGQTKAAPEPAGDYYEEPAKKLPVRKFDVQLAS